VTDDSVPMSLANDQACPCGRDRSLKTCCLPLIHQEQSARTAEDLMRSRYTAHVLMESSYLLKTWHSSYRPTHLTLPNHTEVQWINLDVHSALAGQPEDSEGIVDYTAMSRSSVGLDWLKETARFTRESGEWRYVDGIYHSAPKISRNAPCPCGSGIKYKRCCAR
jgi:SEC-C motif-containing protein